MVLKEDFVVYTIDHLDYWLVKTCLVSVKTITFFDRETAQELDK